MELWETDEGDRWICVHCQKDIKQEPDKAGWRKVLERDDPELRCFQCGHGEFDFED